MVRITISKQKEDKKMKKRTKILLTTLCAVMLVAASVMGTLAYLTSQDEVVNTFTVGKLSITLDETDTDDMGNIQESVTPLPRVKANEYKLIPGHTYVKDPTVHVAPGSEASYVFAKVENGLSTLGISLDAQITALGWTALEGVDNVYWKAVDEVGAAAVDLAVFEAFTVPAERTQTELETCAEATIKVTAYAAQQDTFESAKAAWTACFA